MTFYSRRVGGTAISIRRVAVMRCFTSIAAAAMALTETVSGAAGTSGLAALLIASPRHIGAAITMTYRLKVPEAATTDNRPAVEDGQW